jgi:polysaccharide pyruvyl transferase WcaK-like protein
VTADRKAGRAPRVGLFGLLGSGNIGNDASMESVLSFLNKHHPDAVIDAMCMGPERLKSEYGITAIPLQWSRKYEQRAPRPVAIAAKMLSKGIDAFRTAAWVRGHDAVIVPGMGVMEASTPLWPWGVPYAMFLLSASGRAFRVKVALVSVGAGQINQPMTRSLFNWAAKLAFYRSYRDVSSRDAMRDRGIDTSADPVYPDLVFGIPTPDCPPGDPATVGVGVMSYYGTNDDRKLADELHAAYLRNTEDFIRWLLDNGRKVRIFSGDACDESAVQQILDDVRASRPDLGPDQLAAESVSTFAELTAAMMPVGSVVATRYHNVMCALKLGKPVISTGYAQKNIALMTDMGLAGFCQSAGALDIDLLIEQFTKLEAEATQLRSMIAGHNDDNARRLDEQFARLSATLFPGLARPLAIGRP